MLNGIASKGFLRAGFLGIAAFLCAPACSSPDGAADVATQQQALSSLSGVLGFESRTDWTSQQAPLLSSENAVQGAASLAVALTQNTQITSVPVSTLGAVGTSATLDIALPAGITWGEARLVLRAPSLGESWRDLGGQPLGDRPGGTFHRLAFPLPEDLRTKLGTSFDDLTFTVVLNGPPGQYLLDRLDFGVSSLPAAQTAEYAFTVSLPVGTEPKDFVLAASTELRLADRVAPRIGSAPAPVFNATGITELGVETRTGTVRSGGNVFLRDRSRVDGDVVSAGTITEQTGVTVTGSRRPNEAIPQKNFSWSVRRSGSRGPVALEPDTSSVVVPGAYGAVNVKSRAKLFLRGGEYFFRSLILEPQAELILEDTAGPVTIYVESGLTHRGVVRGLGARMPDLLLGYVGSDTVVLEAAFPGTVVAPNATLRLQPAPPGGHRGAFYAKRLFAEPDTVVQHRAFPWATLVDLPSTPFTPMPLTPSPAVLVAGRSYQPSSSTPGSASPATPVDFTIPVRIPVTGGNAGNAAASLTFRTPSGQDVTCTYRGGATVAHPTTPLELARGKEYRFESCSNGQVPGNSAQGTNFGLAINGDSANPKISTHAELALGKGSCSSLLAPPISAAQSIEMAENFEWIEQPEVAETNPDGHPALYYANIYIRNDKELELLQRFLIHFQTKPLFTTELRQYEGQCGTFEHEGDGQGQFVFAVIPGKIYNLIRDSAFKKLFFPPPASNGHKVLFKAIVMRATPPGATYADGSLRYDHLQNAGFYYLNIREMPPRDALNEELLGGGAVSGDIFEIVEFVVEKAYAVTTAVVRVLGAIDRFLFGSVNVTLRLDVLNRDPAFERQQPMQRAWHVPAGPGERLGLPNVQVEILQWALRPVGLYPTNTHSYNGENGTSTIEVARSSGGLLGGTTPRGSSGVCYLMKNGMGELVSGLLPNEVCDFRGSPEFGDFEESKSYVLRTDNYDAHVLSEISEAYRFVTRSGHVPRRARILTGATAAVVSTTFDSGLKRVWAPCLRFTGTTFNTLQFIVEGLMPLAHLVQGGQIDEVAAEAFGLPWYIGRLASSDIVMPRHSSASTSRSLMVHEYGHFVMCSMLHEVDPDLLTNWSVDVIAEGSTVQAHDEARYVGEAFADFIAGQVTGSTNYFNPGNTTESGALKFCNGSGSCLDTNLNSRATGDDQIGRLVTTWHDAFDGAARGTAPTNGDSFRLEASPSGGQCAGPGGQCLRYAPATYGLTVDDGVQLPISALADWIRDFAKDGGALREDPMMMTLGNTMHDHNANWCQMCGVFGPHSPTLSGGTLHDIWRTCIAQPIAGYIPVPVPNADLRIRASDCSVCPAGQISLGGVCTACATGERVVGNACVPCGVGQIVTAQGTCQDCGPTARVVSNTCVPCAFNQGADLLTHTSCISCPFDAVMSLVGSPNTCDSQRTVTETISPTDPCPDRFWVNVVNLQAALADRTDGLDVDVRSALAGNQCGASNAALTFGTPQPAGGFVFGPTTTATGALAPTGCSYQTNRRLVSRSEIIAGATSRAIVAAANTSAGHIPTSVTLKHFCQPL